MLYLVKRISDSPKNNLSHTYDYLNDLEAIEATKQTSERVHMYKRTFDDDRFEISKDGQLVAMIETVLSGFCPVTRVITPKIIRDRLKGAKQVLSSEYVGYFKSARYDLVNFRLMGKNGYYLQYYFPSHTNTSLGGCELLKTI